MAPQEAPGGRLMRGESEGHEEPLESDGTTLHGRGKEWRRRSRESHETLWNSVLDRAGSTSWKLQIAKLTQKMDSGGRIHMEYEVWSSLLKSRRKNSLRNRENALGTRIWTELVRQAGSFKSQN
ncbi:hypothetical protein CRG98_024372 [Punica granatum]|uniref:Uncharacterized protein n=1 Tax=Punica granatum TaxID=22663 RepID=A0A2I0JG61_PUNGR|nr:hypothetical protein CRG98_024372 [Punica granatum]